VTAPRPYSSLSRTLVAAASPGHPSPNARGGRRLKGETAEWLETTILSHDGEERSRSQNRCDGEADGELEKEFLT